VSVIAVTDHGFTGGTDGPTVRVQFGDGLVLRRTLAGVLSDQGYQVPGVAELVERLGVVGGIGEDLAEGETAVEVVSLREGYYPGDAIMAAALNQSDQEGQVMGALCGGHVIQGMTVEPALMVAVPPPIGLGVAVATGTVATTGLARTGPASRG